VHADGKQYPSKRKISDTFYIPRGFSEHNMLARDGSFGTNSPGQAHLYGERHPDRVPSRAVSGIVTVRKAAFTNLAAAFTRHYEGDWFSDGPKVW
jgi:hypothetical protein